MLLDRLRSMFTQSSAERRRGGRMPGALEDQALDSGSSSEDEQFYDASEGEPPVAVREDVASGLNQAFGKLSIQSRPTSGYRDKGKGKQIDQGQGSVHGTAGTSALNPGARITVGNVAPPQLSQSTGPSTQTPLPSSINPWTIGTYAGGEEERARLAHSYDVQGKTDSSHLVDFVVAFPYPHFNYKTAGYDAEETKKAKGLGIAYNELRALHRRHVGSYYDEQQDGFNKSEHVWPTPAAYRKEARVALRQLGAVDGFSGHRVNISNMIQLNMLDLAHVQASNISEASAFGLYRNQLDVDAADSSFERTIKASPPVVYIKNLEARPAVTSLNSKNIERQHLSRQEQAELILARQILTKRQYPSQETIESVAREYLSKDELNEKNVLWENPENYPFLENVKQEAMEQAYSNVGSLHRFSSDPWRRAFRMEEFANEQLRKHDKLQQDFKEKVDILDAKIGQYQDACENTVEDVTGYLAQKSTLEQQATVKMMENSAAQRIYRHCAELNFSRCASREVTPVASASTSSPRQAVDERTRDRVLSR